MIKMGTEINSEAMTFAPRQFTFPQDEAAFAEYHKASDKKQIYIAKPVAGSEGNNILLFKE